jgi:protein phosphatase PTC7
MQTEGYTIPHDDKKEINGEDGHFVYEKNGKTYVCVFDGVGSWVKQGVNVKEFVNEMIDNCIEAIEYGHKTPELILDYALNETSSTGSATVIFAVIEGQSMKVCQIGDAGMLILNKNKIVFETDEQQHSFNYPYQIGKENEKFFGESPNQGMFYRIALNDGDQIILGSDGLFDNLKNEEVVEISKKYPLQTINTKNSFSKMLCEQAYRNSKQQLRIVPFFERAYEEGAISYLKSGGKEDDITCIVVIV